MAEKKPTRINIAQPEKLKKVLKKETGKLKFTPAVIEGLKKVQPEREKLKKVPGNVKFTSASIKALKKERLQPGMVRVPTKMKLPGAPQPGKKAPEPAQPPSRQPVEQAGGNPFKELPFPSPGDRIKAEDFKKLSQSLQILYDIYQLSGTLFGQEFGDAKLALVTHQYEIQGVMSVLGSEIHDLEDEKLDQRKVLQVLPVEPGERQVIVILTEAVETRRTMPNLVGKTYADAVAVIGSALGDVTFPAARINTPDLIGTSLSGIKTTLK